MQRSRAVSNLGVLAIGLIAGCVGTYVFFYVHVNNSYMVQFNSAADAVFVEQTSALKALRDGTSKRYQERLESVIWQQMSRLYATKEPGRPLSASVESAIEYHCGQLESDASGAIALAATARAYLCKNLL
jgi:hypothetical protein